MSTSDRAFEVRVLTNGIVKMLNFRVGNPDRAKKLAKKHGQVLGVKKVGLPSYIGSPNCYELEQEPLGLYLGSGVYEKDIDLDVILGLRKKGDKKG